MAWPCTMPAVDPLSDYEHEGLPHPSQVHTTAHNLAKVTQRPKVKYQVPRLLRGSVISAKTYHVGHRAVWGGCLTSESIALTKGSLMGVVC